MGRPFFARFDPQAVWFDDLRPAFGERAFFFEKELEPVRRTTHRLPWSDRDAGPAGEA